MTIAQRLWDNNQLFADIEGLVLFNDELIEVEYKKIEDELVSYVINKTTIPDVLSTYPEPSVEILPNGNIASFPDPNNIFEIGTEIQSHPSSPLQYKDKFFYFGEGGMEDDGFIACISENNKFEWSMFFYDLNTIQYLKIDNNLILARSKNNLEAIINLSNPTEIIIKS